MLDVALAFALLGLAGAILWYILMLVARATNLPLGKWFASWRLARCVAHATAADRLIEAGNRDAALVEIRRAFFLAFVADREIAARVTNHHTGLLSRMLALTADRGDEAVRLLSLAKVDRLLSERAALLRRLSTLRQSGTRAAGADATERLRRNSGDLEQALDQLVAEIRARPSRPRLHS